MTILNISATLKSTTVSEDSSRPQPPPRRPITKIILPKKKPLKWSTGVAPGDYGGPPLTTKLRKYWGGNNEDPLTSDEFIWNNEFMGRMKQLFPDSDDAASLSLSNPEDSSSGFLSFGRVMTLDSVNVDLSKQLMQPVRPSGKQSVENAAMPRSMSSSPKWRLAPTRREQDKWDRATKAATGGSDVMFRESRMPQGNPEEIAAQSREQYFKLKNKLQVLTLSIGGIGLISAYLSYTPEVAASFGAGLVGSLVYIRMLGSTVDSMADGAKGLIKGAAGQPRLLVPVVLVMMYNRWNAILVPDYGFMHLDLIPMLVGFFSYKIATFIQAIDDAVAPR